MRQNGRAKLIMGKITYWVMTPFLLATIHIAEAQQANKIPVIGTLHADSPLSLESSFEVFRQGLRKLGYVVGQNILIENRYAEGKRDRLPELAAELVRLKVDVIFAVGGGPVAEIKNATSTLPIVASAGDLVGDGLVASLAKPGGNITGLTNVDSDFSAKRLELLKESFPRLSRVAVLSFGGMKGDQDELKETRAVALSRKVRIQSLEINDPSQIPGAFDTMSRERAEGLIIANNSFTFFHRRQLLELAVKNRLPTMCGRTGFVEAGGLMSYAADRLDSFRRAAIFVDKILKGAKPADLPVEQPTKFEFVINLKTAKQIGVTIPQSVLYRADKVIR
jgi:putative tryptophan/tyrosine transport system substrate-binding protein